ncbi:MAG: hypothetical protein HZB51_25525 [Chloroflexi bacterium]|nr:hypothetical protein [Chloroflexota bacterium]
MDVPSKENPVWNDIISCKVKYPLDFLAAKIMLGRLILKVRNDPSLENLAKCGRELHNLYDQNVDLPCVQRDLARIFGGER